MNNSILKHPKKKKRSFEERSLPLDVKFAKGVSKLTELQIRKNETNIKYEEKIKKLRMDRDAKCEMLNSLHSECVRFDGLYNEECNHKEHFNKINDITRNNFNSIKILEKGLVSILKAIENDRQNLASSYRDAVVIYDNMKDELSKYAKDNKSLKEKELIKSQCCLERFDKLGKSNNEKEKDIKDLESQVLFEDNKYKTIKLENDQIYNNMKTDELLNYQNMHDQKKQPISMLHSNFEKLTKEVADENERLLNTNAEHLKTLSEWKDQIQASNTLKDENYMKIKDIMPTINDFEEKINTLEENLKNTMFKNEEHIQTLKTLIDELTKNNIELEAKQISLNQETQENQVYVEKKIQEEIEITLDFQKDFEKLMESEKYELDQVLVQYENEMESLRNEINVIVSECADIDNVKTELEEKQLSSKLDIENSSEEINNLKKKIESQSNVINDLSSNLAEHIKRHAELENNIEIYEAEYKLSCDMLSKLNIDSAEKTELIETLIIKNTSMENICITTQEAHERCKIEIKEKQKNVEKNKSNFNTPKTPICNNNEFTTPQEKMPYSRFSKAIYTPQKCAGKKTYSEKIYNPGSIYDYESSNNSDNSEAFRFDHRKISIMKSNGRLLLKIIEPATLASSQKMGEKTKAHCSTIPVEHNNTQ